MAFERPSNFPPTALVVQHEEIGALLYDRLLFLSRVLHYGLFQKLKLIGKYKFYYLIITLTKGIIKNF